MTLIELIERYAVNGIVSLKELKSKNIKLYRLLLTTGARQLIKEFEILDDLKRLRTEDDIIKYLKLNFNELVDITTLLSRHSKIYRKIAKRGNVKKIIESWGFETEYSSRMPYKRLRNTLIGISSRGYINKISRRVYNKVYYVARQQNISVKEMVKLLGFKLIETTSEYVKELKDNEGFSFSEIAKLCNISKSKAYRLYKE